MSITTLIRHGSTDSNGEGLIRGWVENDENQLTDKGLEDAKRAGEELKKMKDAPTILIPSDLQRAVESAKIMSEISGIKVGEPEPGLRSQDMGQYTGQVEEDVRPELQDYAENKPDEKLPGGSESHNEFVARIKKTLKEIESKYPNERVGIVTHHQVERLIASDFGKKPDELFKDGKPPGSITQLKKDDTKDKIKKFIKKEKFKQDPTSAIHDEVLGHTDSLEQVNEKLDELKDPLSYLRKFLESGKGEKGDKGDSIKGEDGYTPIKGKDYFTDEEISQIINYVLERATPKKGVDYFDGDKGDKGDKGEDGKSIEGPAGKDGKDGVTPKTEEIISSLIEYIKENKPLEVQHIRNWKENLDLVKDGLGKRGTGYKLTDQRWHGAGTSGSVDAYVDAITTTGGVQAITLTHTPVTVLTVDVNGAVIYATTDYTLVGTTLTLLNAATPAGLTGKISYLY